MRRFVLECRADGFRTSPIAIEGSDHLQDDLPGLRAATIQLAEHTYAVHAGDEQVGYESVTWDDR